jgi:hypothetical protein
VITQDFENPRKTGEGCHQPKYWFNMYLVSQNRLVEGPTSISNQTGYGEQVVNVKGGQLYKALVINWDDASATTVSKFTLSTYGSKSKVEIFPR